MRRTCAAHAPHTRRTRAAHAPHMYHTCTFACACACACTAHTLGLQVRNEMEGLMGKLEKDLTESLIKVILQSRVTKKKAASPDSSIRDMPSKSLFSSSAGSEASGVGAEEGAAPKT